MLLANSGFAFWNFLGVFLQMFSINNWLNPPMPNCYPLSEADCVCTSYNISFPRACEVLKAQPEQGHSRPAPNSVLLPALRMLPLHSVTTLLYFLFLNSRCLFFPRAKIKSI